jgi:hypothetical protein
VPETKDRESDLLDGWLNRHSALAVVVGLVAFAASYLMERHTQSADVDGGVWYLRFVLVSIGVVCVVAAVRTTVEAFRSRRSAT